MAIYLSVDKYGQETAFYEKPDRRDNEWVSNPYKKAFDLRNGTIEFLTGIKLSWSEEPLKIEFVFKIEENDKE